MGTSEGLEVLRRVVERRRPHLTVPRRIDRAGVDGPTERAARRTWRRSSRGLYVPIEVSTDDVEQRIVEAAAGVVGHPGAVTGWAALRWMGGQWFDGYEGERALPVPVVIATFDRRPQAHVEYSAERLGVDETVLVDGVRVTVPVRSATFEMRRARSIRAAVRVADMAAYDDLVDVDELRAFTATLNGWTGVRTLRAAIPHVVENCWSPQESGLRWTWTEDAGCPRPTANAAVFDLRGRHVATVDLLDEVAGVVGEYDGEVHLAGGRRRADLQREDRLRGLGLEYVAFVAGMSREERVARLRAAYARAAERPAAGRSWTTTPPPGWRSTATVASRRALEPGDRDRLLRYRAA
ncbi:hypothetical protein ACOACO_05335 [Nocardioides sp. CPCC 205120]|uniref:hypothetical protein n=1 Tax=Nocardioides sp. CPCC 205120 TaxID=3406462 RepID=UPI003B5027C1